MATTKNITMKQFNGTDYDTLYPETIAAQIPDVYSQNQTLSSSVSALYGLGSNATPNDVFGWIGKYNQHWWMRRRTWIEWTTEETVQISQFLLSAVSSSRGNYSIQIADSIDQDELTGVISLSNPTTYTFQYPSDLSGHTAIENAIKGKYISNAYENQSGIYLISSDVSTSRTSSNGDSPKYRVWIAANGATKITPKSIRMYADWEYVLSSDRNAYLDSGISDGYEYVYIGIPFENTLSKTCIVAGSYVGTGTYGPDNPVTIELGFKPLVFFPNCTNQGINGEHQVWVIPGNNFDSLTNTSTHYYVTWGDTFFSWYARNRNNSEDIVYQFNEAGKTYYYLAIGIRGTTT